MILRGCRVRIYSKYNVSVHVESMLKSDTSQLDNKTNVANWVCKFPFPSDLFSLYTSKLFKVSPHTQMLLWTG